MLDINNLENTFEVRNLSNSNQIDENLKSKKFFWTLEFVPSVDKVLKYELDKLIQYENQYKAELIKQFPGVSFIGLGN